MANYESLVEKLREMTDVQCSDGNWDYDPYMHGMANGMIFALSLLDSEEPEYLKAPAEWLKNKLNKPVAMAEEAVATD